MQTNDQALRDSPETGARDLLAQLATMARTDGSAGRCAVPTRDAADGLDVARVLADAAYYLSALHGRHPGVIDLASLRRGAEPVGRWFGQAIAGFEGERLYLTRLVVAAGPMPSTPGQASADSAVNAQRHAIELLARSDRAGCAVGAAIGLVLDWQAIRPLLDAVALRFDVALQPYRLPGQDETLAAAAQAAAGGQPIARAIRFGAEQMLAQHRHLWDLLDARRSARRGL